MMDFDMTDTQTPRGRVPDMKLKIQAEHAKKELSSKVRTALSKLKDRDTQQQALEEMQKICQELKPQHVEIVHKALFMFDGEKNQFARAQIVRLFADVAKSQFEVRSLGKVVSKLCERARDSDGKVREACAETIGDLARIFCSSADHFHPQQRHEESQDLDATNATDGGISAATGLNIFFNPILKNMEGGDNNQQMGNALALAHVIFNCAAHILPHLEKLTQRILAIMDRSSFLARAETLMAIANIIEVCPEGFAPLMEHYFARIQLSCSDKDFNVRKAAMETIETLATRIDPDVIMEFKPEIQKLLEKLRYDTKPPVREAAMAAIQAMSKLECLYQDKHQHENSNVPATTDTASEHAVDLHTCIGHGSENEDPSQLEQSGAAAPAAAAGAAMVRVPMLNIKSAVNRVNQSQSNKMHGDMTVDALSSKPMRQALAKGVDREREGGLECGWSGQGEMMMKDEGMPTKETWNQLLHHFDRITQQQTQLIEMVSSFGDSSRERLELLEQKVYSIELRMSGMEQRQSFGFPGMPPTPARAAQPTPARTGGGGFTPRATACVHGNPKTPSVVKTPVLAASSSEAMLENGSNAQTCS